MFLSLKWNPARKGCHRIFTRGSTGANIYASRARQVSILSSVRAMFCSITELRGKLNYCKRLAWKRTSTYLRAEICFLGVFGEGEGRGGCSAGDPCFSGVLKELCGVRSSPRVVSLRGRQPRACLSGRSWTSVGRTARRPPAQQWSPPASRHAR